MISRAASSTASGSSASDMLDRSPSAGGSISADTMSRGISRYTGRLAFGRRLEGLADVTGRRARVVEDRRVLGDFLVDLELRLERLHLVVHVDVGLPLDPPGTAGQHDERRLLGVRARDGVDHVEPPAP